MKKSFCMFCGGNAEAGNHDTCRSRIEVFRHDMRRLGGSAAFQLAEAGYYGKAPHRADIDPTDWRPRARELREQGLSWRKVARALNAEGFKSKHGHCFDATLILCNLKADERRRKK